MRVSMRLIWDVGNEYGSGRQTFERERQAVLTAGYRVVPIGELTAGERAQAGNATVIETTAEARYLYTDNEGSRLITLPYPRRYVLSVELEPERGEE